MTRIIEPLGRVCGASPNFRLRITYAFEELFPPIRAYLHNAGLDDAFKSRRNKPAEFEADRHLLRTLTDNMVILNDASYLIAAIWGDSGARMIDLFRYAGINKWPGNPDVAAFVFRNGVYVPKRREITCGDTLVVLGREEEYRRTTRDLNDYVEHPPTIDGLVADI
jgi:hypothetical protein